MKRNTKFLYHDNYRQTENIFFQTNWEKSILDNVWKHIIEQKISNQIALLQFENLDVPDELFDYLRNVEYGDVDKNSCKSFAGVLFCNFFQMIHVGYLSRMNMFDKQEYHRIEGLKNLMDFRYIGYLGGRL